MDKTTTYVVVGAAVLAFVMYQQSQAKQAAAAAAAERERLALEREQTTGVGGFLNKAPQLMGSAADMAGAFSNALGSLTNLVRGSGGSTSAGGNLDDLSGDAAYTY